MNEIYEEILRDGGMTPSKKIKQIKITEFEKLDQESKSECEGLRKMFQMLSEINLKCAFVSAVNILIAI